MLETSIERMDAREIFDSRGKLLYQDNRGDPEQYWGTGLAIADNGRFAYGLVNRIYYRSIGPE